MYYTKKSGTVTLSLYNSYPLDIVNMDSSASTEVRELHHQERQLNGKAQLEQAFDLVEEA